MRNAARIAAAAWIPQVGCSERKQVGARFQLGVKNVGPRQVKIGTPLSELVDLTKSRIVDAEFDDADIRAAGNENTDGSTCEFELEHGTGSISLEHWHVYKTLPHAGAVLRVPRGVADKTFDKFGISNIHVTTPIVAEPIKRFGGHKIGRRRSFIGQRRNPCGIKQALQ